MDSPIYSFIHGSNQSGHQYRDWLAMALLHTYKEKKHLSNCLVTYLTDFHFTGKSLSEALIFASTNPQYDNRLFIELQVQYMKIPSSTMGRTCCVQKLFLTFRTILFWKKKSFWQRFTCTEFLEIEKDNYKYLENYKFPYIDEVNKYEKMGKIGHGTFGEVFQGRDRKNTEKLVALKKILMENETEGFPITGESF